MRDDFIEGNWELGGDFPESDYGGRGRGGGRQESSAYEGTGYGSDYDSEGRGGYENRGGYDEDPASSRVPRYVPGGTGRPRGFRGTGPKGWSRSDAAILEEVCESLKDAEVDVSAVSVDVTDGLVTLSGEIDGRWAKRYVEDLAYLPRGVRDVRNRIEIA